jgi:hypothetical protein
MDWDAYLNLQYQLLLVKTRIMQVHPLLLHTCTGHPSALLPTANAPLLLTSTQIFGSAGQPFDGSTGLVLPNFYAGMGTWGPLLGHVF